VRVGKLLDKYNHTEGAGLFVDEGAGKPDENQADQSDNENSNDEDAEDDEGDEKSDEGQPEEAAPADESADVEMTPEIDAGFAQLAQERIARHPFRYYLWLPIKRANSLWFDTHSQYYPFEGDLLPLQDLDRSLYQQYWLPLFAALTLIYSLLGVAGAWFLSQAEDPNARLWVLLAVLLIFLRIGFFATLENPEPRYVVEVFPFLSVLGGIALLRLGRLLRRG